MAREALLGGHHERVDGEELVEPRGVAGLFEDLPPGGIRGVLSWVDAPTGESPALPAVLVPVGEQNPALVNDDPVGADSDVHEPTLVRRCDALTGC